MSQSPEHEGSVLSEQSEAQARIDSLRLEVLTGIMLQFTFSPAEPQIDRYAQNSYDLGINENGEEGPVLYRHSDPVMISPDIFTDSDEIKEVKANVVITYKVNVIEPEHWKRVLLRKKFVPAILESTDEILDVAIDLKVTPHDPSIGSWWTCNHAWHPVGSPEEEQSKNLNGILETLDLVEECKLTD